MLESVSFMCLIPPQADGKGAAAQDELGLWLVFCDEGISLHTLMYSPAISGRHDTSQESPQAMDAPESVQQPSAEQSVHGRGAVTTKVKLPGRDFGCDGVVVAMSCKHSKLSRSPQMTKPRM